MQHEFVEFVVLLAVEGGGTVGVLDTGDGLAQLVGREAFAHMGEVEFADEAPDYGIAVQARGAAAHIVGLEGVPQGVAQVEGLADVLLGGVLGYNVLLGVDGLHNEVLQGVEIGGVEVVSHERCPVLLGADESVLDHLGKAGTEVGSVEGVEEGGAHDDGLCRVEGADFILERVEVDTGLATYGCVDHGEQGGGDIDAADAALIGGCGKAAKVGDHAAAYIEQERVAGGAVGAQFVPYVGEGAQVLVVVACCDGDEVCLTREVVSQ